MTCELHGLMAEIRNVLNHPNFIHCNIKFSVEVKRYRKLGFVDVMNNTNTLMVLLGMLSIANQD